MKMQVLRAKLRRQLGAARDLADREHFKIQSARTNLH